MFGFLEWIDFKKRAIQALFFFSLILPLFSDDFSFDRFYGLGWVVLSFLLLVLVSIHGTFQLKPFLAGIALVLFASFIAYINNYQTDLAYLAHWFTVVCLFSFSSTSNNYKSKKLFLLPVIAALLVMSSVLVFQLVQTFVNHGYSHQLTYHVAPFFAHRNIALEHVSLLAVILLAFSSNWKKVIWWFPFILSLVIVYQARAALLVLFIGFLVWGYKFRGVKKLLIAGGVIVACYFLGMVSWSYLSFNTYNNWFSEAPDIFKSIDPVYNIFYMSSSNERLKIWTWTFSELNIFPHGFGQWKILSQGNIILPNYNCLTIVRRPHNELLLLFYELGIVGGVFLIGLLVVMKPSKYWLVLLPILLFSFPLERASMLVPIWILLSVNTSTFSFAFYRNHKLILVLLIATAGIIHLMRWRADYLFASFVNNVSSVEFVNDLDEVVLNTFPYDFMLNHYDKYKAFSAIDAGETDKALDLVWTNYRRNPNFYGNYIFLKQLAKDVNGQEIESNMKYSCEVEEEKKSVLLGK